MKKISNMYQLPNFQIAETKFDEVNCHIVESSNCEELFL
jgi:hypothetical protein